MVKLNKHEKSCDSFVERITNEIPSGIRSTMIEFRSCYILTTLCRSKGQKKHVR